MPATDAMSWGYSGAASTVSIPFVGDIDVSWPADLQGTCDFYYGIPQGQRPWQLRCGDLRLAREAAKVLIRAGRGDEFLAMLDILPPAAKSDGRLDIYRAICLLEKDDPVLWPQVEEFLTRPHESVDTHEGEPTLSNIFYEFEARKLSAAEGGPVSEGHRRRVREELAVPPHLDFRQIRDPAFDAKTKAGE